MPIAQLITKINNKHFINLVGNGVMSLMNMATTAILYRYMSVGDIGMWVFFQSTFGLVDTLRAGLLTTAFVKYYAGASPDRADEVVGSAWSIAILVTGVFVLLNLVLLALDIQLANGSLALFLKWFGFVFVITLPSFMAGCILQAEQRFEKLLLIRFISQGLSILFFVTLAALNQITLTSVLYAGFGAGSLTSLVAVFAGWTKVSKLTSRTSNCTQQLVHFGKYSVGNAFGSSLFRNSDTLIINFALGPAALAVYNLGLRLLEVIEIPLRSLSTTVMPLLSAAHNTDGKEAAIQVMKKYTGMLSFLLIPICIFSLLFADTLVGLVNQEYLATEAANIFRIFILFALLFPADRFIGLTLDAVGLPKVNFLKLWAMLAINIITDVIGVVLLKSVYGIAIASLFPTLGSLVIGYIYLNKYSAFSLKDVYKRGYFELMIIARQALNLGPHDKEAKTMY